MLCGRRRCCPIELRFVLLYKRSQLLFNAPLPRNSATPRHGVRPSTFGAGACGKRVALLWDTQGKPGWYSATVAQFCEADQRHYVAYDDGTQTWHHLDDETDAEQLQWHQPRTRYEAAAQELPTPTAASNSGDVSAWLPPLLCDWSYTSEGKLTGRVFGKRGYKDGTMMTTSVVSRAKRFQTHATTESGTIYLLGPRAEKANAVAAPSDLPQRTMEERRKEERRNSCRSSDSAVSLECSICRDLCELSETDWDVTVCGHAFHEVCLLRWVTHQNLGGSSPAQASCPNCRHPLSSSRLRLFDQTGGSGPGWSSYYLKDNLGIRRSKAKDTTAVRNSAV